MYTPREWRIAFPIVAACLSALAVGLVLAWRQGSVVGAATCGGTIIGVVGSIAWALRHFLPKLGVVLLAAAFILTAALWLFRPQAGVVCLGIGAGVFLVWFLVYDIGFTGKANAEVASPLATLGGSGQAGRALIVYHSTHGGFQPLFQRALTDGLQAGGWQVDMTTASRSAPTDLSRYQLLVLGAPSYNWEPARAVVAFIDRVGDLRGMPVALIVSGGGMTDRAMGILRRRVEAAHGRIVETIEIWTARPNPERYGASEPTEIMRRSGARLTLGGVT